VGIPPENQRAKHSRANPTGRRSDVTPLIRTCGECRIPTWRWWKRRAWCCIFRDRPWRNTVATNCPAFSPINGEPRNPWEPESEDQREKRMSELMKVLEKVRPLHAHIANMEQHFPETEITQLGELRNTWSHHQQEEEDERLEEQLREAEEGWRDDCGFMRLRHSWVSGLLHKYDHKYYPAALSELEEES